MQWESDADVGNIAMAVAYSIADPFELDITAGEMFMLEPRL